jgi:LysM repeat protein
MRKDFRYHIVLIAGLLLGPVVVHAKVEKGDSTVVNAPLDWSLVGELGTFHPAGWKAEDIPALTRAQGVKMGLLITEYVDERFDPIKGKKAAAHYWGVQLTQGSEKGMVYKKGALLLSDLAKEANLPLRLLEEENPHLRRDILPAGVMLYGTSLELSNDDLASLSEAQAAYQHNLEVQYNKRREQVLSFMPDPTSHKMITYTVRSGDYLGKISANTGAKVSDIQKWNRLKGTNIYVGQKLTIWVPGRIENTENSADVAVAAVPEKATEIPKSEPKDVAEAGGEKQAPAVALNQSTYLTYEVKPGDTLWGIAGKFPGVSPENIKSWNKVNELIKAGEKLKIHTATITDYSPEKYPSTL